MHERCAQKLIEARSKAAHLSAFIGLDGFVDEIIHVVDQRQNAGTFTRIPTIAALGDRLREAAGKSTNIELVTQRTKLGGNGPIMAEALANFGVRVTYLGNLGFPALHPVFKPLAEKAEVYSIAEPCHTDALEFQDGKVLFGKSTQLNEITWANIQNRFGREKFAAKFNSSSLVGFVNWTMVAHMSAIWESLLHELCPALTGPRRFIFFDLADPQKRTDDDIVRALKLISQFQNYFDVILGMNEKEAGEIAEALGLPVPESNADSLVNLAREVHQRVPVHTIAIHPVTYALAFCAGQADVVPGPYVSRPMITTGAGDHFNAGLCLAKLLGFDNAECVLLGVATSGFYVANGRGPHLLDLVTMLRQWPSK